MVDTKVTPNATAFNKQLAQAIALQASLPAAVSATPIVVSAVTLQSLSLGQVLQVTAKRLLVNGEQRNGIEINGKFVEAQLPSGIKDGDQLTVQVADKGTQLVLKILGQSGQTSSGTDPKIDALLKILNLSSEQLDVLSDLIKDLIPKGARPTSSDANTSNDFIRTILQKNLPEIVLAETELAQPRILAVILGKLQPDVTRIVSTKDTLIDLLVKQIASGSEPVIDQIDQKITAVLRLLNLTSIEGKLVKDAGVQPQTNIKPALELDQQVQKLLQAFKKIGATVPSLPDSFEKEVVEMLKSQSNLPQALEIRLKTVLALSLREQALPLLIHTLDSIDTSDLASQSGKTKEFLSFVAQFRDMLKELVGKEGTSAVDPNKLEKLLRQALATIITQFSQDNAGQLPKGLGNTSPSDSLLRAFVPELSRQNAVALRSIEVQVRSLLLETEHLLSNKSGSQTVSMDRLPALPKLLEFVRALDTSNTGASPDTQRQVKEFVDKFRTNLQMIAAPNSTELGREPEVNIQELREVLTQALKTITNQFQVSLQRSSDPISELIEIVSKTMIPSRSANGAGVARAESALPEPLREKLARIDVLIRQLIKDLDLGTSANPRSPNFPTSSFVTTIEGETEALSLAKLKSSPEILSLIKVLKDVGLVPPKGANQNLAELTDFARKLMQELDTGLTKSEPQARELIRNILHKAQEHIRKNLGPDGLAGSVVEHSKAALETVRSVENMVRSQELLTQINPVMRALGEPTMMLFPMLLSGMLSKLEVTVHHQAVDNQKDSDDKHGSGQRGGQAYEQVSFSLGLPTLGQIEVSMAHRKSEILLNITFEREDFAKFVEARLPRLEEALRRGGYERVSLTAVTGDPRAVRPDWLVELVGKAAIIA